MSLKRIEASKLKSRMLRASVYDCFITGKNIQETSKELKMPQEATTEYYVQFSAFMDREIPDKSVRINQAKAMEAELFKLIALKINFKRINELAILVPKFCA